MIRILISGYYGFNNIGDESILRAVVDNLRGRLENIEITVLSRPLDAHAFERRSYERALAEPAFKERVGTRPVIPPQVDV